MPNDFSVLKSDIKALPLFELDTSAGVNSTEVIENNLERLSEALSDQCSYTVFRQVHVALTELLFLSGKLTTFEKVSPDSKLEMIDGLIVSVQNGRVYLYYAAKSTFSSTEAEQFIDQLNELAGCSKKQLKKRTKEKLEESDDQTDLIPIGLLEIYRLVSSPVLANYHFEKSCLELILTFD